MRNYATALANNREYVKSNDLLRRVKRLMPAVGNHVMLQITFAENFLNLHQLDSAVTTGTRHGPMNRITEEIKPKASPYAVHWYS